MADRLKVVEPQFREHGGPARVTIPGGSPVTTRMIDWGRVGSSPESGGDMAISELRREMSLRRDHVPTLPTGTVIESLDPETLAVIGTFRVDGIVTEDLSVVRAVVVPA